MLASTQRDLPDRQRTLRGAIDWSHELLSRAEQAVFRRAAVFAGGADLDGLLAVIGGGGSLGGEPLDLLSALVDRSLIRSLQDGNEARFEMLETIREYAFEQLIESGERATICDRHADHYAAVAERGTLCPVHSGSARAARPARRRHAQLPRGDQLVDRESQRCARGDLRARPQGFLAHAQSPGRGAQPDRRIIASLPADARRERAYIVGIGAELASWNTDYETRVG